MARERLSIREVLADGTVITRTHYSVHQPSDTPRPFDARSDPPRNDMPRTQISIDTFGVGDTSQDIIVIFDSTPTRQNGRQRDAASQRAPASSYPGRTSHEERNSRIAPPATPSSQSRYTSYSDNSRPSEAPFPVDFPLSSKTPPAQYSPRQSADAGQYSHGSAGLMRPPPPPTQHGCDHIPEASREEEQPRRSSTNAAEHPQISLRCDNVTHRGSTGRKKPVQEAVPKPQTGFQGGTSCASQPRIRSGDYRNIRAPTAPRVDSTEAGVTSEHPVSPNQRLRYDHPGLDAARTCEESVGPIASLPLGILDAHTRDQMNSTQYNINSHPLRSQRVSRDTTHRPSAAPPPAHREYGSFQSTLAAQADVRGHRLQQHRAEAYASELTTPSERQPIEAHRIGRHDARTREHIDDYRNRNAPDALPDTEVSYGTTPFYQADLPTSPPNSAAERGRAGSQEGFTDYGADGGKYVRSPKISHAKSTKHVRPPKTSHEDLRELMLPPVLVARQVPEIASYLPDSSSTVYGRLRSDQDKDRNASQRDRSADVLVRKRRQNESIRQRGQDDSLRQVHQHETGPASRPEEPTRDMHSEEGIRHDRDGAYGWNGQEGGNHAEESIRRSHTHSQRPYRGADERDTTSSSSAEVSWRDTARSRPYSPSRPRKQWPRNATPGPRREASRSRFASRNRSASSSSGKLASSSEEEAQETFADSNATRTVRTIPFSEEPTRTAFAEIRPESGDCQGKSHRGDSKHTNVWHLVRTSSGPSSKVGFRDKPAKPMCLPCFDDKYTSRKGSKGHSSRSKSRTRSRSRAARRGRSRTERDGADKDSESHRAK